MSHVSVLVPYTPHGKKDSRVPAWEWIKQRWEILLPEAEIVMGVDTGKPYSKTVAVNDAFSRSSGSMLVIADADSWVERDALEEGIMMAARRERLVMPWTVSYRFTEEHSKEIMQHDPRGPLPVTAEMRRAGKDDAPSPASAAMVLVLQRTGFMRVGGMDPRFRGWGSEDVSFGLSCWTLLGRNAFILGEAYALFHHRPVNAGKMRVWDDDPGALNFSLWHRYRHAQGRPLEMAALCAEHSLGFPVGPSPELTEDDIAFLPDEDETDHYTPAPMITERMGGFHMGDRV